MTEYSAPQESDTPLWKTLVLSLAHKERDIGDFSDDELEALFTKAVSTMKPDAQTLASLRQDKEARRAFALRFARFYRAGTPPWSGFASTAIPHNADA